MSRCTLLALLALSTFCACGGGSDAQPAVVLAPVAHRAAPGPPDPQAPPSAAPPRALSNLPASDRPLPSAFREALLASLPDSGDPAVTLFRQAAQDEESGDMPNSRREYLDVIVKSPSSSVVPCAYLGFAEMFFAEADAGAPEKLDLARQAYEKVLVYPAPKNLAYAYAWHRLGLVLARRGDAPAASAAQHKAIEACATFPELPLSDEIAAAARGASQ
jgi:hypothetical protein